MALKYVQTNTLYLSGSGVIVGATSITLSSLTDIYGNALAMSDFGSIGYGTLEPDTTNEEAFLFTGITANANLTYTLTGIQSTLAKSPYTGASGLVRAHAGGTKLVISDTTAFWANFANKANDEVIAGNWTFNNAPTALSSTPASTTALGNVKLTVAASTTLGNPTISIASPAVITLTGHGLISGDTLQLTTTGALPTGLFPSTTYFVLAAGLTANSFEVALTVGGTPITTTGSQSGTHTLLRTTPFAVGNDDPRLPQPGEISMFGGSTAPLGKLMCDGGAYSRTTYAALFAAIGSTYGAGDGSTTFNVPDLRSRMPLGKGAGTKTATIASVTGNVVTVTGITNAANNEFQTGQAIVFNAGNAGNLVNSTTYYVVRTGNLTFSVATTLATAQNGTVVTLAGTETGTFTLTLSGRALGDTGGEENHAMSLPELISHNHLVTYDVTTAGSFLSGNNSGTPTNTPTGSTGGNAAMNNMSPFAVINFVIKT